jgi:hypothetical protein
VPIGRRRFISARAIAAIIASTSTTEAPEGGLASARREQRVWSLRSIAVNVGQWIGGAVCIRVDSIIEPDGITFDVPSCGRVVVAITIVMQPHLSIEDLTREAQVVGLLRTTRTMTCIVHSDVILFAMIVDSVGADEIQIEATFAAGARHLVDNCMPPRVLEETVDPIRIRYQTADDAKAVSARRRELGLLFLPFLNEIFDSGQSRSSLKLGVSTRLAAGGYACQCTSE